MTERNSIVEAVQGALNGLFQNQIQGWDNVQWEKSGKERPV